MSNFAKHLQDYKQQYFNIDSCTCNNVCILHTYEMFYFQYVILLSFLNGSHVSSERKYFSRKHPTFNICSADVASQLTSEQILCRLASLVFV